MAIFKKSEDYYLKKDLKIKGTSYNLVFPAGTPMAFIKILPPAKSLDIMHLFNIKNSYLNIEISDELASEFVSNFMEEAIRSAK